MTTHELKTWPAHFANVWLGVKTFELRRNDRDFREGDRLHLREWSPETESHVGPSIVADVLHLIRGPLFGLEAGFAILSICVRERFTGEE